MTFTEEHLFSGTADLHHVALTWLCNCVSHCPWMQTLLQWVQEYIEPAICIPVCAFAPPAGKLCYPSHLHCKSICSSKLSWSLSFSLNIPHSTSIALIYQSYGVFFLKFSLGLLKLGSEMKKNACLWKTPFSDVVSSSLGKGQPLLSWWCWRFRQWLCTGSKGFMSQRITLVVLKTNTTG